MQHREPTAPGGAQGWLESLGGQLGMRTEAIEAALDDIAEWCGERQAVGWVDGRHDPKLTVYVVADGSPVLYRVNGQRGPAIDSVKPDDPRSSDCECSAVPIASDAKFTLSVSCRWKSYEDPGTTARRWEFRVADNEIQIEYPPAPLDNGIMPRGPDPTSFARTLAAEIARVQATGGGDGV